MIKIILKRKNKERRYNYKNWELFFAVLLRYKMLFKFGFHSN